MSFSSEWNTTYNAGKQDTRWPWSDLVSYVYRYVPLKNLESMNVLELGCATGANIPFFITIGVNYFGIEGSQPALELAKKRFPKIEGSIRHGDFTQTLPFEEPMDLIVDRASLTHNTTTAIRRSIELIAKKLRPGGIFIGIDWFSTVHNDYALGVEVDSDPFTKNNFQSGQFVGVGNVHFSSKEHLLDLFKGFRFIVLDHKQYEPAIGTLQGQLAAWNFVVVKED